MAASLPARHAVTRRALAHQDQGRAAARLVFLLSGVSYYKTAAPRAIDFGETGALTGTEEAFLHEFYLQGLAEFA